MYIILKQQKDKAHFGLYNFFCFFYKKGLVDFRFSAPQVVQMPKFIGHSSRSECICEDVPKNTFVTSLKASQSTFWNKKLCYSIVDSPHFQLNANTQPMPDGDVYLMNEIYDLKKSTGQSSLNMTALLSYCNESPVLGKQLINFQIYPVNKYAPMLLVKVRDLTLKLNNSLLFILLKY